jgi:hypothetical protein
VLSIIDNGIALSAIGYRLFEFGITPNRLAVLGSNVLVMGHLIYVSNYLLNFLRGKSSLAELENSMTINLPLYAIWASIVSFLFPLLFQFS